jgi:lysophospholipase L1-like esterase
VNFSGTDPFNGDLAAVMFFDRQLSDAEVATQCKFLYRKNVLDLPAHVIFGGDSKMTALGGAPDAPDQLATLLLTDSIYFYLKNTAVSGRVIADVMTNLPDEVLTPYQSDVVNVYAIMIGHNDLIAGRTTSAIYTDIATLCQAIQDQGYKVIIMTDLYATVGSNSDKDIINANIRANWATFADAIADTNALPNAATPSNTTYFSGGIHPTSLLGTDIANLLKPLIEGLLAD